MVSWRIGEGGVWARDTLDGGGGVGTKLFLVSGRIILWLLLTVVSAAGANEEGPAPVATLAAAWPPAFMSSGGFDAASRGAILAYTAVLARYGEEQEELKAALGVPEVALDSVYRWKKRVLSILVDNFRAASLESRGGIFTNPTVIDPASLRTAALEAERGLPEIWRPWYRAVAGFFEIYADEQLRLAARFPKTSSEIATFSPAEVTGFERADRHFLLTFDDGPSPPEGSTDRSIALLRKNNLVGLFFVLGDNLAARMTATSEGECRQLYGGMTLGVHGMNHHSHAGWSGWRESVAATQRLLDLVGKGGRAAPLYRPPYGQRSRENSELLGREGYRLVLWNIDTVDWNEAVAADGIVGRTQLLMALWRRGIILFHDRYPKVVEALPPLLETMRKSGVVFDETL